jgi:Zn finger protein HypA/HybF involved in hydrogenase expression
VSGYYCRKCRQCGNDFVSENRLIWYCTTKCASDAHRITATNTMRRLRHREAVTCRCRHCSNTFTPARADAKFCSNRCRVAAHRAKP